MSSERCERAVDALMSESMPIVLDSVVRANSLDLSDEHDTRGARAKGILAALRQPYIDALCVVMYAGRDEFVDGHPYDDLEVDTQFREWWDYLCMDGEQFAREQIGEKFPLGRYLRRGAYMFRIDEL